MTPLRFPSRTGQKSRAGFRASARTARQAAASAPAGSAAAPNTLPGRRSSALTPRGRRWPTGLR